MKSKKKAPKSKIKKTSKIEEISSSIDPFKKIQNIFENNIFLHEVSIKEIGGHAKNYDRENIEELLKILKNLKINKKTKFSKDDLKVFLSVSKKHPAQGYLFSKNTLVSMVSTLDILFIKLFEFYYKKFPEKLSLENQTISFKDLKNINKIEDAQNFLISREIESLLIQKGLTDRLNILNKEMGLDIKTIDNEVFEIKKLIKIRNLIVHNEGLVDGEYVKRFGEEKVKVGDYIKLSDKYLTDSLYLIYFVGTYILQDAQLHFSEGVGPDDFLLNNLLHTLIKNQQYGFIRPIYDFALNNKIGDLNKKLIIINYCIGLKKQGKSVDHIKKVLNQEDWSVDREDFEMCKSALVDDHKSFYLYLGKIIKNNKISTAEIDDWAIFKFYKEQSKFKNMIKNIPEGFSFGSQP